jgi:hypothetical protein
MANKEVSDIKKALIIFVDIIDSSVHSSFLGIEEYAKKVIEYQNLFIDLGKLYFEDKEYFKEKISSFCKVDSKGDEGLVFVVDDKQEGKDLLLKAIKFVFELKARLKISTNHDPDSPPKELKIAAGIHYGDVAIITENKIIEEEYRKPIVEIIGYSINYAKRIESSSRIGKLSQVFLSLESAELLTGFPIVFCKHYASLKGIEQNEIVYEIQSAFLDNIPMEIPINSTTLNSEPFLSYFSDFNSYAEFLRESWLKSFIVSVLHSRYNSVAGNSQKKLYFSKISKLIWQKQNEDDPILLYCRARECEDNNKFTRAISYYKKIIEHYPEFIFARIKLVKDCYEIIKSAQKISTEEIFVKDTAEELLDKFDYFLKESEKEDFKKILTAVNTKDNKKKKYNE